MPTVKIEIDSSRLQGMLQRLANACSEDMFDGGMRAIGEHLKESTVKRLEAGITPEGNAFKPLSAVTLALRVKRGRSGTKPLIDTGQLHDTGINYRMDGAELVLFANRAGAHAVHFGTDRAGRGNKVRISRRRFMGVSNDDLDAIGNIVRHILAQAMRGET